MPRDIIRFLEWGEWIGTPVDLHVGEREGVVGGLWEWGGVWGRFRKEMRGSSNSWEKNLGKPERFPRKSERRLCFVP